MNPATVLRNVRFVYAIRNVGNALTKSTGSSGSFDPTAYTWAVRSVNKLSEGNFEDWPTAQSLGTILADIPDSAIRPFTSREDFRKATIGYATLIATNDIATLRSSFENMKTRVRVKVSNKDSNQLIGLTTGRAASLGDELDEPRYAITDDASELTQSEPLVIGDEKTFKTSLAWLHEACTPLRSTGQPAESATMEVERLG